MEVSLWGLTFPKRCTLHGGVDGDHGVSRCGTSVEVLSAAAGRPTARNSVILVRCAGEVALCCGACRMGAPTLRAARLA